MTTMTIVLGGTVIMLLLLLGVTMNALRITTKELYDCAPLEPIDIEPYDTIQQEDDGRVAVYQNFFNEEMEK